MRCFQIFMVVAVVEAAVVAEVAAASVACS
jgi:hypothetical protein